MYLDYIISKRDKCLKCIRSLRKGAICLTALLIYTYIYTQLVYCLLNISDKHQYLIKHTQYNIGLEDPKRVRELEFWFSGSRYVIEFGVFDAY